MTSEVLRVRREGTAGPYLQLPASQRKEVCAIFDRHGVYYWVDEIILSINDGPYMAAINFGLKGDPRAIQLLLDGVQ